MTEQSDRPSNVRELFKEEREAPKIPEHKEQFDKFVHKAAANYDIMAALGACRPDLRIQPFRRSEDEDQIYIGIDHASELAHQLDWLGGDFCNENISFSIQPDGSLLRIIELLPLTDPHKLESRYINANLGTGKARSFLEYITDDPSEDLEGILPFLEIDNEERQEIAVVHRRFRRKHISLAKAALPHSKIPTDTLD